MDDHGEAPVFPTYARDALRRRKKKQFSHQMSENAREKSDKLLREELIASKEKRPPISRAYARTRERERSMRVAESRCALEILRVESSACVDKLRSGTTRLTRIGGGVYFLLRGGVVVYVGQTNSLSFRHLSHKDKLHDETRYVEISHAGDRLLVESYFIKTLLPVYNVSQVLAISNPSERNLCAVRRWLPGFLD